MPIAGESEEKYDSDATPKEDGEKRPTPNPRISSGGSGWLFSSLAGQAAIASPAMGVPPESSPSVPVKGSQHSAVIPDSYFNGRR